MTLRTSAPDARTVTITIAVLALAGLLAYGWSTNMEKRATAQKRSLDSDPENYMLAARTLLRQHGREVDLVDTISKIDFNKHPGGTLVIADSAGLMTMSTAQDVMAWVKRGNTLLIQPRPMNMEEAKKYQAMRDAAAAKSAREEQDDEDNEDNEEDDAPAEGSDDEAEAPAGSASDGQASAASTAHAAGTGQAAVKASGWAFTETVPISAMPVDEIDPIGTYIGARRFLPPSDLACMSGKRTSCPEVNDKDKDDEKDAGKEEEHSPAASVSLPESPYRLELGTPLYKLVPVGDNEYRFIGDEHGAALRAIMVQKGHVVMLAASYFSNNALRQYDHGELLLDLVKLNKTSKRVTIVRHLDVPRWYVAIWSRYRLAIISLACGLLLLLWAALRRFGPVLPNPVLERRSLMEHIAASGAWLWKAEGGRQQLLEAARRDTLALVGLRAPALARMQPDALAQALATASSVAHSHVIEALQGDAAPQVTLFTRQIRTLQILRNHYER